MELYVTTEWRGTLYRATYGKCSIREARRYYKTQRQLNDWLDEQEQGLSNKVFSPAWEEVDEDIRIITETWMAMGEILAALRQFERGTVQDEGDEEERLEPIVKWDEEPFPEEWKTGHASDTMPYEFFEGSLYASRKLNPGMFPTSPDFLARPNVRRKSTV